MTCLELSRRKAEASVGEGPRCGLWRTLAALSAVPGGRRATSILALGAEGERARPSFCLAGRLVKPQSRAKGGSGDACSAASAPRAHRCCGGRGRVFIRVQSQFSHTLDKLFVELLYS